MEAKVKDRVGRKLDFVFKVGNFEWRVSVYFLRNFLLVYLSFQAPIIFSLVPLDTELTRMIAKLLRGCEHCFNLKLGKN